MFFNGQLMTLLKRIFGNDFVPFLEVFLRWNKDIRNVSSDFVIIKAVSNKILILFDDFANIVDFHFNLTSCRFIDKGGNLNGFRILCSKEFF